VLVQHPAEYEGILAHVRGPPLAKQLAATYIPRFVQHFPNHVDAALNAQIDLCEDESMLVR
jgi:hypothetical protein